MKRMVALSLLLLATPAAAQDWLRDQQHCEQISAAVSAGALDRITRDQIGQLSCGLPSVAQKYDGTPAAKACLAALASLKRLDAKRPDAERAESSC